MLQRRRWKRGVVILILLLVTTPVMAGLIYKWNEDPSSGSAATGLIEFTDTVSVNNIIDPSIDIQSFSFSNIFLSDWSLIDIDFNTSHYLEPLDDGLDLTLTPPPSSSGKKKAATKTAYLNLDRSNITDSFFLSFTKSAKKKAATKNGDPTPSSAIYWDWESTGIYVATDESGKKKAAKKALPVYGYGYWTLQGGPVPVPEPSSLLLVLTGIAAVSAIWRRMRRRFR